MTNAPTHGNEACGTIVVDELLCCGMQPRWGKLTWSFANVQSYLRFEPTQPDKARFIGRGFNHVWTAEKTLRPVYYTDGARSGFPPMHRAIDSANLLLDLNS